MVPTITNKMSALSLNNSNCSSNIVLMIYEEWIRSKFSYEWVVSGYCLIIVLEYVHEYQI